MVGKGIYWELCEKLKFDHTNKWYMYNPESVQNYLMFSDTNGSLNRNRGPELVIVNKKKKKLVKMWTLLRPLSSE